MADSIKGVGLIITFKDMVSIHGLMAENTKEIIIQIKNMDKEHIHGLQAKNIKVGGKMISSMVKLYSQMKKERAKKVFGMKEKERNG